MCVIRGLITEILIWQLAVNDARRIYGSEIGYDDNNCLVSDRK